MTQTWETNPGLGIREIRYQLVMALIGCGLKEIPLKEIEKTAQYILNGLPDDKEPVK